MSKLRVFSLLLSASPALRAQDQSLPIDDQSLPIDIDGLRGISAVEVVVEDLNEKGASKIGLTKDDIQTDVELRLRSAGLRVISEQESLETRGHEEISVNVTVLPSGDAASATVSLQQSARLSRNGQEVHLAATWAMSGVHSHPTATALRDEVKDLVDSFLNDWLKQNPRR